MNRQFSFDGSARSSRRVVLLDVERPHANELTLFVVRIADDYLEASCSIESLGGDSGFDLDSELQTRSGVSTTQHIRLSKLFVDLGSGALWEGHRRWRSLAGELEVSLAVDDFGHVDVTFQISPRPWEPTWSATCTLRYNLGDLARLGTELGQWFDESTR